MSRSVQVGPNPSLISGASGNAQPTRVTALAHSTSRAVADAVSRMEGDRPSLVTGFSLVGDGVTDDTTKFQNALDSVAGSGKPSWLEIPAGYNFAVNHLSIPSNVTLIGQGAGSLVSFIGTASAGIGRLDVPAGNSGWGLENFSIDGGVTSPVGIDYASITSPIQASLSAGSSLWVHGGAGSSGGFVDRVRIRHTGGYSILFDATGGSLSGYKVRRCEFSDNRPHTFGVSRSFIYGGWTSGIHYESDGLSYSLDDLLVELCSFLRMSGHCFWGHAAALSLLNSNIRFLNNFAQDHALDMCEMGGVNGFQVRGNRSSRGGYFSSTDGAVGVPMWGTVTPAVIDHTGLCINGDISGNILDAVNGTAIDGDGLTGSKIDGNIATSSWFSSDPSAASGSCGPLGTGSNISGGVNLGNSNGNAGGSFISIIGNLFTGFGAGAIRLYAARSCKVAGNTIYHPANAAVSPIVQGPLGSASYLRATDNDIGPNTIFWSPASIGAAVAEDSNGGAFPFVSSDVSLVHDNKPIGNCYEFFKDPNSSSTTGPQQLNSVDAQATAAAGVNGKTVGTIAKVLGTTLATHSHQLYRSDGALLAAFSSANTTVPGSISVLTAQTAAGVSIPATVTAAGDLLGRSLSVGIGIGSSPYDLITNSSVNILDAQGSPVGTTHGYGMTLRNSALGYMVGVENTDNALNANGLLVKIANNNAATRAITVNVGGSDLFAVNGLGFVTAQAFSVGSTGVITNSRDFYGDSLSVGSTPTIAASAAGLTIANDRTAYLAQVYIGANGASPALVIDNTGAFVGAFNPSALTMGTVSLSGTTPIEAHRITVQGNGAQNDTDNLSPAVFLLGTGASSMRTVENYIYPYPTAGAESREAALMVGTVVPSSSTNYETNGLSSTAVSLGSVPNVVAGSFFAVSGVTGGKVFALNTIARDYLSNNSAISWASNVETLEIDMQIANVNSTGHGIASNILFPLGRTNYNNWVAYRTSCTSLDSVAGAGIVGSGVQSHYWDVAFQTDHGSAEVALSVGRRAPFRGNNSQFLYFYAGSSDQYLTQLYTASDGTIVLFPNTGNVGGISQYFAIMPFGALNMGGYLSLRPPDWQPSTGYSLGAEIFDGTYVQICVIAGTSYGSPPSWQAPTVNTTEATGVRWLNIGSPVAIDGVRNFSGNSFTVNIPTTGVPLTVIDHMGNVNCNTLTAAALSFSTIFVGSTGYLGGSTPSGNGYVNAFNLQLSGGNYVALAAGNRAGYLEFTNVGANFVVTTNTAASIGSNVATMSPVTAIAVSITGGVTLANTLSCSIANASTALQIGGFNVYDSVRNSYQNSVSIGLYGSSTVVINSSQQAFFSALQVGSGGATFTGSASFVGAGFSISASNVNSGGYYLNSMQVMDGFRNLQNIANLGVTTITCTNNISAGTSGTGRFVCNSVPGISGTKTSISSVTITGGIITAWT